MLLAGPHRPVDLVLVLVDVDLAAPVLFLDDPGQLSGLLDRGGEEEQRVGVPAVLGQVPELDETGEQQVARSWESLKDEIEGWDDETPETSKGLDGWEMPKTVRAVRLIGYWLNDADRKKVRGENKDNQAIQASFAEAEKTLAAAVEKMNGAFGKVMDEAEKLPTRAVERLSLGRSPTALVQLRLQSGPARARLTTSAKDFII